MIVLHADPGFTGTEQHGATRLLFAEGVARHDGPVPGAVRNYLAVRGYAFRGDDHAPRFTEPSAPADDRPHADSRLWGLTVADLTVLAADLGLDVGTSPRKADLVEAIAPLDNPEGN